MLPLKITPIGGVGEIGNNCFLYENNGEAIVVDCGIDPGSNEVEEDILKRFESLYDKNVKAILLTHAHLDHAAVGIVLAKKLNVPLYVSRISKLFIQSFNNKYDRQTDNSEKSRISNVDIKIFEDQVKFNIGIVEITPIQMEHSIPESFGFLINWAGKHVFHLGDCKLTGFWLESRARSIQRLKEVGAYGIDLLVMDVLNIRYPGFTEPESEVVDSIIDLINQAPDKKHYIFLFASNLRRISALWNQLWRRAQVHFNGASMINTSYLLEAIAKKRMRTYSKKVHSKTSVHFGTGCQGEEKSFIRQLADSEKIEPGDRIYISASLIPGKNYTANRRKKRSFRELLKRLKDRGAEIFVQTGQKNIYGDFVHEAHLHVSGHEGYNGLSKIVESVRPKWLLPYHVPHQVRFAAKVEKLAFDVAKIIGEEIFVLDAKNHETIRI